MDPRLMEKLLPKRHLEKAAWESRNEGVHERVNFDDTIWGFNLAGGVYYGTPLRVTSVLPDSRADKAGIRPGDKLTRINDIDTTTLTIQEAHDMIVESGIYIRLAVSAPDDLEDSYNCYQDEIDDGYDSEEERRKEAEKKKKRRIVAKTNSRWSLMWPWTTKRKIIYKESNCFLVPSSYEAKHKDRLTPLPEVSDLLTLQPKEDLQDPKTENEVLESKEALQDAKTENGVLESKEALQDAKTENGALEPNESLQDATTEAAALEPIRENGVHEPMETLEDTATKEAALEPMETLQEALTEEAALEPTETLEDAVTEDEALESMETLEDDLTEEAALESTETLEDDVTEETALEPMETLQDAVTEDAEAKETLHEEVVVTEVAEPS